MKKKDFYDVNDVMKILKRSKDHSYKIIRKLNLELRNKGIYTETGRVNAKYFNERYMLD